jgi:hypothetical protein
MNNNIMLEKRCSQGRSRESNYSSCIVLKKKTWSIFFERNACDHSLPQSLDCLAVKYLNIHNIQKNYQTLAISIRKFG